MKVNLKSNSKLQLVKAVKEVLDLGLKEAKDLVDEQEDMNDGLHVIVDSEKTEAQIKAIVRQCGVTYTLVDITESKLQEITDDDLDVSICSVDEMSIAWECRMLFTHKQATRVLPGLVDAKLNVTETHVMYEGDKVTMLTVTKTFPSGTKKEDLEKFEHLTRTFIEAICVTMSLEDVLEKAKKDGIKAFKELQNYE